MESHKATFEIESKSDAHVINLVLESVYNSLREESTVIAGGTELPNEMLDAFKTLQMAAEDESAGKLTIIHESGEGDKGTVDN